MTHPTITTWQAARSPDPDWTGKARTPRPAPPTYAGTCVLTGTHGPVVDTRHILSGMFTQWDRLPYRHAPDAGMSIPAAWAFRLRAAMQRPHATIDGTFREVDPPALFTALHDLDHESIITVPQSRQKHLLPYAETGTVRVDDRSIAWTTYDKHRLGHLAALRALGFGETALTEPAPRWAVLAKHPTDLRLSIIDQWGLLDPWRDDPTYLHVACMATRTPKGPPDE